MRKGKIWRRDEERREVEWTGEERRLEGKRVEERRLEWRRGGPETPVVEILPSLAAS